ncbi:MAG: type II secretion system F family protein [SAR324 cluster bacterium]|nr:type II secretion system F family protein [SAR324 cluster bacterium]
MPSFVYKALNAKGQSISGKVNARSQEQAIKQLQSKALYPLNISKIAEIAGQKKETGKGFKFKIDLFRKTVDLDILADFSRQFGMLIEAGIPYHQGLQILSHSTKNRLMNEVITEMNLKILEGSSLAKAMGGYPDIFPSYYRTAIMAGEKTGHLGDNMLQQAEFLESQTDLKRKVQSALIYPGIMSVLGLGIVIFMIEFILPKITPIFSFLKHSLPLPTRIMIGLSDFIADYSLLLIFGILASLLGINYYLKKPSGRYFFDKLLLRLPVVGPLMRKVCLLRFALSFSTLLQSGIAVKEALSISGNSTGNMLFEKSIKEVAELTVNKGYSFSQALQKSSVFDSKFVQVVKVGEESGALAKMIKKLSENLKIETQASIQKFVAFLEPIIILIMALMVGSIVLAILLPIFEMNQLIQ